MNYITKNIVIDHDLIHEVSHHVVLYREIVIEIAIEICRRATDHLLNHPRGLNFMLNNINYLYIICIRRMKIIIF